MAFTQLTDDLNIIQALDDEPNDVGGLSAAQLKAKFDEAGNTIKTYLNSTFLTELGGEDGAPNIGIYPIDELVGVTTLQDALTGLVALIQDVTQGAVADGSITEAKLANLAVATGKLAAAAVTTAKLADSAVTTAKITDSNVTTAKLADGAVTTAKLGADAVTAAKIADDAVETDGIKNYAVTEAKLGTSAVATAKIKDGNVTSVKLADSAVVTDKLADDAVTQAKIADNAVSTVYTATIGTTWVGDSAPYAQDVTISGLLSTDNPIVDIVPDSGSYATAQAQLDAWAEIFKMVASDNTLTVLAHSATSTAIPIQVMCVRR